MKCPLCDSEMAEVTSLRDDSWDWLTSDPDSNLLTVWYTCEKDRLRMEMVIPVMASRMQKREDEPRLEWRMPT